jgi:hypothetical protein
MFFLTYLCAYFLNSFGYMSDLEWTTVITSTMLMKGEGNRPLWSSGMKKMPSIDQLLGSMESWGKER